MVHLTRLEKLLFRLEAQHACLDWAFGEIAHRQGPVFELGLGHGRTYDHLRTHLPGREIYVFDREVDCFPDCMPPGDRLILGDLGDTLEAAGRRFAGQVVLAHADVGSYDAAANAAMSALVSRHLPAVLAPGAIILSDLPLEIAGARPLALPKGAREGRYFLFRHGAA
jgi:hypothetical protein